MAGTQNGGRKAAATNDNGTGSTSIEGSDILEAAFLEAVVSLQTML